MAIPPDEPKAGAPEWLVTFGDMMTLLLCFFVLLLSFSTMEAERFKVVAGYIRQAFGVQMENRATEIPAGDIIVSVEFHEPQESAAQLVEQIVQAIQSMRMEDAISAEEEDDGVRVRIDGSLVFGPGSAVLQKDALPFLEFVAKLILETGGGAEVEGHTDNIPIKSEKFPSNWELSSSRAGAVVRFLVSRNVPGNMLRSIGLADTVPLTENFTQAGRRKNRRVEILIKKRRGADD